MSDIKLGKIIEGAAARDAIHIAIAPVVAGETLNPGDHVGLTIDGTAKVLLRSPIGIVDPFLKDLVKEGQQFYMLLYPGTITGLRHEWTHPGLPEPEQAKSIAREASEKWLTDFAVGIDMTYDELIVGMKGYIQGGDEIECIKMEWVTPPEQLWDHFEAVTGIVIEYKDSTPFACCI